MNMLKNQPARLTLSKALMGLACLFTSFCLTVYVSLFAPALTGPHLLVFVGFLAASAILAWAASRLFKSAPPLQTVLLSIAAAVLALAIGGEALFPFAQEVFISLTAETAGEICLCDVSVDGENIPVSQAEVVENSGWQYREKYDNFVIYPEEDETENRLTLRFFAKEVRLGFPLTSYAGSVAIASSAGGSGMLNLYRPEQDEGAAVQYAGYPIACRRAHAPWKLGLSAAGLLSAGGFLFLILLHTAALTWKKFHLQKERQRPDLLTWLDRGRRLVRALSSLFRSDRGFIFLFILLATYCLLAFIPLQGAPDRFTARFLALFTAVSYLCLSSGLARRHLEKYKSRGKMAVVAAIALYASFASFGQQFFLNGNTRMHFSAIGLLYVLLGMAWFIPVIEMLLLGLERIASSRTPRMGPAMRRQAFWALLVLMCLCQAVVLWGFWPGGFATDSLDLLKQAIGRDILDWHPAINAILYRIILTICPRAGALVAVQLFFFALLCTEFLMLGYDYGVSFKTLAILGVIFSLLPNQVIFGITPLKDYLYTLALLWGTYLLIRLALNPKELQRWQFLLALPLSLFFIYALRHNGIVPFLALLLLFGWITWRHFPKVKLRLAAVSLSSILLIVVYKGPVFSLFQVSQTLQMSPYTTMLCAVASCANKGLPLSEESTAIMESVLPLDQWATYYNRYQGHDPYYWGRGELANEYPFDPTRITAKEAFTVYLEALRKYPDVVIKDRLDGMDLLWDVRQPPDSFNTKGFFDVLLSEGDNVSDFFDFGPMKPGVSYYNHSFLSEIYRKTVNTPINSLFDMLLWRSGAYLILLLALGLFWWGNRMKSLLWATVPLLGQIAGLALVLYHQSYRYIAAVQMLTLALVFCSVFLCQAQAGGSPWETREEESIPVKGGGRVG